MGSLKDLGEFGFIARALEMAGRPPREVIRAIGDDCAVLDLGGPEQVLVTTDAVVEGRHFRLDWMSPFEVGQRATAGALSDIAAMGGRPLACLATFAIPPATDTTVALELLRGVAQTGARYAAPLIGGDTVSGQEALMLDLVVVGRARTPWLRSGARPGDVLLLTGCLGGAAAALEILMKQPAALRWPQCAGLLQRMVDPTPRLAEAAVLAQTPDVHAAIDISDGLLQDAGHMARASGVRLEIRLPQIPAAPLPSLPADTSPNLPAWYAATSGEEYELLLAVTPEAAGELSAMLERAGLAPTTIIGSVLPGEGVTLLEEDGRTVTVEQGGWDHFRSTHR